MVIYKIEKYKTITITRKGTILVKKTENIKHKKFKIKRNNKYFLKLTITEERKPYRGVNRISTHYHIVCECYLVIVRFAILITPYYCIDCINAMSLPWDKYLVKKYQPRYSSAIEYKYYPILGKYIY